MIVSSPYTAVEKKKKYHTMVFFFFWFSWGNILFPSPQYGAFHRKKPFSPSILGLKLALLWDLALGLKSLGICSSDINEKIELPFIFGTHNTGSTSVFFLCGPCASLFDALNHGVKKGRARGINMMREQAMNFIIRKINMEKKNNFSRFFFNYLHFIKIVRMGGPMRTNPLFCFRPRPWVKVGCRWIYPKSPEEINCLRPSPPVPEGWSTSRFECPFCELTVSHAELRNGTAMQHLRQVHNATLKTLRTAQKEKGEKEKKGKWKRIPAPVWTDAYIDEILGDSDEDPPAVDSPMDEDPHTVDEHPEQETSPGTPPPLYITVEISSDEESDGENVIPLP